MHIHLHRLGNRSTKTSEKMDTSQEILREVYWKGKIINIYSELVQGAPKTAPDTFYLVTSLLNLGTLRATGATTLGIAGKLSHQFICNRVMKFIQQRRTISSKGHTRRFWENLRLDGDERRTTIINIKLKIRDMAQCRTNCKCREQDDDNLDYNVSNRKYTCF